MNYSRIMKFSIGNYLLLMFVSVISAFVVVTGDSSQGYGQLINLEAASFIISLSLFAILAIKQINHPYKHAILVAFYYWLITLTVSFFMDFLLNTPFVPVVLLKPFLYNVLALIMGTYMGIQLRQKLSAKTSHNFEVASRT